MRVIYRSASKRQVTQSSTSLTQEALTRFSSYIPWVFSQLGVIRSSFCRFFFCYLTWVAVTLCILPWVGFLTVTYLLWRKRVVPWLFRCIALQQDLPETAPNIRGITSGLYHILVKVEGLPSLQNIHEQVFSFLYNRRTEPDGWKLKRSLVQLPYGMWAWRKNQSFRIENHVTLCDEVGKGTALNNQNLKYRVNELCGEILDDTLPPWHIFVVPFVQKDTRTDGYALLIRAHHLLQHLFHVEEFSQQNLEEIRLRNALSAALSGNQSSTNCNEITKSNLWNQDFTELKRKCLFALRLIWQAPAMFIHEILCSFRLFSKSRIFTGYKSKRALCWSDPISKDLINRLKEASGAKSIESVLLSCFSGALHHYQQVSGNIICEATRSLLRQGDGFVRVILPVGECCPKARLHRVQGSLTRGLADDKYSLSQTLLPMCCKVLPYCVTYFLADVLVHRYPILVDIMNITTTDSSVVEENHWKTHQFDFGLTVTLVQRGENVSICVMSEFQTLQRPDVLISCFGRAVLDLALAFNVRYERKPSPPSTPIKSFSGRSF